MFIYPDDVAAVLSRLLLAVNALCNVLPSAPTAASLSAADITRNTARAEQLLGLSGNALSENSAVLTVLRLVHRCHFDFACLLEF